MFCENLRSCRISAGYTQQQLAEKLCVVRQTVSKWEKGISAPDCEMLIRISEALGVSGSVLLSGSETTADTGEDTDRLSAGKDFACLSVSGDRFIKDTEKIEVPKELIDKNLSLGEESEKIKGVAIFKKNYGKSADKDTLSADYEESTEEEIPACLNGIHGKTEKNCQRNIKESDAGFCKCRKNHLYKVRKCPDKTGERGNTSGPLFSKAKYPVVLIILVVTAAQAFVAAYLSAAPLLHSLIAGILAETGSGSIGGAEQSTEIVIVSEVGSGVPYTVLFVCIFISSLTAVKMLAGSLRK